MMMLAGFGALAAVIPSATSGAAPARPAGAYLFHDEFDGPAGSAPDPSKWVVASHRTPINNPTGFDRPEFFGQYRDSRQNVFVDGKSNLVLRATRDGGSYSGGNSSGGNSGGGYQGGNSGGGNSGNSGGGNSGGRSAPDPVYGDEEPF